MPDNCLGSLGLCANAIGLHSAADRELLLLFLCVTENVNVGMSAARAAKSSDLFNKVMLGLLTGNVVLIAIGSLRWGLHSTTVNAEVVQCMQSIVACPVLQRAQQEQA